MLRRIWVFGYETWMNYVGHNGTLQAAAISYYVLFSFVPMLILLGGVLGFVVTDEARRSDIEERILDALPLSRTEGRDIVEDSLNTLENARGAALIVGIAGTLWTASAAFSSIRRSLNAVWGIRERRPFFMSKLIDFAQLGLLGLTLVVAAMITAILAAVREFTVDWLGFLNDTALWEIPGAVVPLFLTFSALTVMYRYVPAANPAWREAAAAAAPAAFALWILTNGFAFYVANFNNFSQVYGALAGIFLFLFFMNMAANILLIGAEGSRSFHRLFRGELEPLFHQETQPESVVKQTIRRVRGLFPRQP